MARDDSKLAFSSTFRYMRIHMKGGVVLDSSTSMDISNVTWVNHSLGYKPYVRAFVDYPDVAGLHPLYFWGGSLDAQWLTIGSDYAVNILVEDNRVGFNANKFGSPQLSVPVYYRIYAEPQS